jgi:hypothetical protein
MILKRMTISPTIMSMSRQPVTMPMPVTTGILAGFDPQIIGPADWPGAPSVTLAIDCIVSEALSAGKTLRETYGEVRAALNAVGLHPNDDDLQGYLKDHALAVI